MDNWSKIANSASGALTAATELLGTKQPQRVGIGFILGLVIDLVVKIFMPVIEERTQLNVSAIGWHHCLGMGLFIVFIPLFFGYVNPFRKELYDERLEKVFAGLRKTFKDGDIDPIIRRQFYQQIAKKIVDSLQLNQSMMEQLEHLKSDQERALSEEEGKKEAL